MSTPATMETREQEVRPLHDPAELRACQEIQQRAWGIVEDGYLVPVATLAAAAAYGGLVLGAFRDHALIGFAFAFRGVLPDGTPILYSQLTGVLPEAQGGGTGRRIKQFQRDWARAQGLPYVAWAFDPLQAMNAHYNLTVLGATAVAYHENFYGTRFDALNPGVPTDRLLCILPTAAPPPALPESPADIAPLLATSRTSDGFPAPRPQPWQDAPALSIAVPADLRPMRTTYPALIEGWQGAIRAAFHAAFAAGYRATAFRRGDEYATYILTKGE